MPDVRVQKDEEVAQEEHDMKVDVGLHSVPIREAI